MFLGGLFKGMSTSTMGFLTGAAEEAQRQMNPEPEEMSEADKLALEFRYDMLGEQYKKLTETKDGIVGFGKVNNFQIEGPNGEILPYQKWQYEVSTTPGETTQEQIAKFIDYTDINDMAFAELSEDQQAKLRLYATNHGQYFNDLVTHQKNVGSYVNNSQAFDTVVNSSGTNYTGLTDFDGYYSTDLAKTGDYTLGTARDRLEGTYNFTGNNTYNNNVGKSSLKKVSNLKKGMKYAAGNMAKSLLTQDSAYKLPEVMYASAADMTQQTTGGYGGTDIEGAWGGSLLKGAFNDNQRERIMNFYKNMNIVGSH